MSKGDANTSLFYTSTLNRRRQNRISSITDEIGISLHKEDDITSHILLYYSNLYTSKHSYSPLNNLEFFPSHSPHFLYQLAKMDESLRDSEILLALISSTLCSTRNIGTLLGRKLGNSVERSLTLP